MKNHSQGLQNIHNNKSTKKNNHNNNNNQEKMTITDEMLTNLLFSNTNLQFENSPLPHDRGAMDLQPSL